MKEYDYLVVADEDLSKLIDDVNAMLKEGWITCGGLIQSNKMYYQAIVKKDDKGSIDKSFIEMDLWHCPKCGEGTATYRHPYAKVWCPKCNYVLREEGDQTIVHHEIKE